MDSNLTAQTIGGIPLSSNQAPDQQTIFTGELIVPGEGIDGLHRFVINATGIGGQEHIKPPSCVLF